MYNYFFQRKSFSHPYWGWRSISRKPACLPGWGWPSSRAER